MKFQELKNRPPSGEIGEALYRRLIKAAMDLDELGSSTQRSLELFYSLPTVTPPDSDVRAMRAYRNSVGAVERYLRNKRENNPPWKLT